ncbi:MAG: hypothetical protein V4508_16900 [Pseudomonadota bacterium]
MIVKSLPEAARRIKDVVNNEKLVGAWQEKILAECERILRRPLTTAEASFVRHRKGFMALEMIDDSVAAMAPAELLKYLNSELGG